MNIGLISPKGNSWGNNKYFREYWAGNPNAVSYRKYWTGLSSGLLIIASLTPNKHYVELIDENCCDIDFERKYDLVAISTMTQQASRAYEIADEFRKRKIVVVLGGIHPTVMHREAKSHANSVVVGEVEYLWEKILEDFEQNKLQEIYVGGRVVDLADSPIPKYELLDPKKYSTIWIQTARGCPRSCNFCAASKIYGKGYRSKSLNQIASEVKYARSIFGDSRYYFADDNFFVNKNKSYELLEKISEIDIRWMAQTDISIAENEKLLELSYKSGCSFFFIGFESLKQTNLDEIDSTRWKSRHLKRYSECIQKIQSHGIGVQGAFMIGFDNDDLGTFEQIADFIKGNNLYGAQITVLTPLPGTELREKLIREKRILPTEWKNYTGFDANFIPKNMTGDELERGAAEIYHKITEKRHFLNNMEYFKRIMNSLKNNSAS